MVTGCGYLHLPFSIRFVYFVSGVYKSSKEVIYVNASSITVIFVWMQYHRIYSPVTFGKKYDPEGLYVKHFIPVLKGGRDNPKSFPIS